MWLAYWYRSPTTSYMMAHYTNRVVFVNFRSIPTLAAHVHKFIIIHHDVNILSRVVG